jgi:hypothetical protein
VQATIAVLAKINVIFTIIVCLAMCYQQVMFNLEWLEDREGYDDASIRRQNPATALFFAPLAGRCRRRRHRLAALFSIFFVTMILEVFLIFLSRN